MGPVVSNLTGTVYLLHFDTAFGHARHYTGWTNDLAARLAQHAAGRGARLTEVVKDAGIGWRLARTWPNATRTFERKLKNQGGASRRCPACGITPRTLNTLPDVLPAWATENAAGGPWHWATSRPTAGATAECEACHAPKRLFDFDLSDPVRRVCWDCAES